MDFEFEITIDFAVFVLTKSFTFVTLIILFNKIRALFGKSSEA